MNDIDKKRFANKIREIKTIYPYWKFNTEDKQSMKEMFNSLNKLSIEEFEKTIDDLVKTNKFAPSISDILKRAKELESQYTNLNLLADVNMIKRVIGFMKNNKGDEKRIKELEDHLKTLK